MNTVPKILFVTQEFTLPSGSSGGAGVYAYEICKALAQAGAEIHVMAPARHSRTEQLLPGLTIHWQRTIFAPLMLMPTFQLQVVRRAPGIIKRFGITSIYGNDYAAGLIIRLAPTVAMVHHPVASEMATTTAAQRLLNLPDLWLERRLIKRAELLTVPSHLVRDLLISLYPSAEPKIHVTLNGIDLEGFKATNGGGIRQKYNLSPDDLVAFFPGGARARRKGGITLVKALSQAKFVQPLHIIISGSSRENGWEAQLSGAIAAAGLQATFIYAGELEYTELPDYLSAADFVVYPSHFEGFGLPVLESLAAGRPVISTRTGEIPYLITDKNGLITDPENSLQLTAALEKVVNDAALRARLASGARASLSATAGWDHTAATVMTLHQQIIGAGPAS